MKAVVLAAGYGTRLRPYTHYGPKHMLPIANKPVLQYVIEQIKKAGIHEVAIIVGHEKDAIMKYFGSGFDHEVSIKYIDQEQRLGLAHAISLAGDFLGEGPFVMILGDNLFKEPLRDILALHTKSKNDATLALTEVTNPKQFGVAEIRGDRVIRVIEKPEDPPSNLAITGIYVFSDAKKIMNIIKNLKPSARGEYEITDTIQSLINNNGTVGWVKLSSWKDTGKPEDLLEANRIILHDLKSAIKGVLNGTSNGSVSIGKGSEVKGKITGPVIIGDHCKIDTPQIGPFVSIGNGCVIRRAELEDCIVMEDCIIDAPWKLTASVLGKSCTISSELELTPIKLIVGDHTKIET